MHFLLLYDVIPEYAGRRVPLRAAHLAHAQRAVDRGELLLGGALADPIDGAVLLFQGASPSVAEAFAREDPYVTNGLVRQWRVRAWTTVVGPGAAAPVVPGPAPPGWSNILDEPPTLRTARLVLRPFTPADAPSVQRLAGAYEVADTTTNIPHPYADGMAEAWIESHAPAFARREMIALAITGDEGLLGAVSLRLEVAHARAELGYWVGVPYWGRGIASEAAAALTAFGFDHLGLNRIFATHFSRNPASGRVMQKVGMVHEGLQRQHLRKAGRLEDLVRYSILREDYARARPVTP
jgi:RimJ/RimL family protein N-acetyltransferase/uncharacterized protein YciI